MDSWQLYMKVSGVNESKHLSTINDRFANSDLGKNFWRLGGVFYNHFLKNICIA